MAVALTEPAVAARPRQKRIGISASLLRQMCVENWDADYASRFGARCSQGIPEDARLVSVHIESRFSIADNGDAMSIVWLIVEHPDWPELEDGAEIPVLNPVFQRYIREGDDERNRDTP